MYRGDQWTGERTEEAGSCVLHESRAYGRRACERGRHQQGHFLPGVPVKDHLSHLLSEKAKDAFLSSVGMMKEEEDPKAVLCRMIDRCYENKEYIMVLCFGRNGADCHMEDKEIYEKGMNDFFLKGQKEGIFRVDIPATAMTQLFAGTMIALFEGEWEGKIASANLAAYWKISSLTAF